MPAIALIAAMVEELATFPGMQGCALMEADTGMSWHCGGTWPNIDQIGEAAIEFWRTEQRLSAQLAALGRLKSAAYSFENALVSLFPCIAEPRLVLVCVTAHQGMDWPAWGKTFKEFRGALQACVLTESQVKPQHRSQ